MISSNASQSVTVDPTEARGGFPGNAYIAPLSFEQWDSFLVGELLFVSGADFFVKENEMEIKELKLHQEPPRRTLHQNAPEILAWDTWTAPAEPEPILPALVFENRTTDPLLRVTAMNGPGHTLPQVPFYFPDALIYQPGSCYLLTLL